MRTAPSESRFVIVWSATIRLFHWLLATTVAAAWLLSEDVRWLHQYAGYVAISLVASRVVLGFAGTGHERFASFVAGPHATLAYLRDIALRREHRHLGHNPAGAVMIVVLLAVITMIGSTGWLMTTDMFWGDERLENIHKFLADGLVILVLLHVCGVVVASVSHHENLLRAMFTGKKRSADNDQTNH